MCRLQIDSYYVKEQYATLSCTWGYFQQQSYGCPGEDSVLDFLVGLAANVIR